MCEVAVMGLCVCWLSLFVYSAEPCSNWIQVSRSAVERAVYYKHFTVLSQLLCVKVVLYRIPSHVGYLVISVEARLLPLST